MNETINPRVLMKTQSVHHQHFQVRMKNSSEKNKKTIKHNSLHLLISYFCRGLYCPQLSVSIIILPGTITSSTHCSRPTVVYVILKKDINFHLHDYNFSALWSGMVTFTVTSSSLVCLFRCSLFKL